MKLKRFVAYLIDILLVGFIASAIASIDVLNPYYDDYLDAYENFNETIDSIDESNVIEIVTSNDFIYEYRSVLKYGACISIISVSCYLLYFVGFQKWNKNQTIGKKLMKIKVVNKDDSDSVSVWRYIARTIFAYNLFFNSLGICIAFYLSGKSFLITFGVVSLLGYLITYAGYLMILFKKDGRGIHDIVGGTKVVEVENVTCEG
jgi:hypothetical protein